MGVYWYQFFTGFFTIMTSMILASSPYVRKGALARRSLGYFKSSPSAFSLKHSSGFHNLSPMKSAKGKVNNIMGMKDAMFPRMHQTKCLTTLVMNAKNNFHIGDEIKTEVNGSLLNGKVIERKGGWYTVHVVENGKEGIEVKRRASKMSLLQSGTPTSESHLDKGTTPDNDQLHDDQFSSNHEPIPMTADSMTIINLDEALDNQINEADVIMNKKDRIHLEQCLHFSKFNKWVVFTDLHCSPSSMSTCLSILSVVHKTAKTRNAGKLRRKLSNISLHRNMMRVVTLD